MTSDGGDGGDPTSETEADIYYRDIEPRAADADYQILSLVADLEGTEIDALPSFYDEADHFVENLFKSPPSPQAQMEIRFSYSGYRITIDRTGHVKLRKERERAP